MKLGVYKRIGNAIRVGGSQLMRKVSIELERDKKMCSETLSSIWSGNAPLQEQSVETLCILFDYLSRHVDMDGKLRGFFSAAEIDSARLVECEIPQRSSKVKMYNADTKLRYMATIYDKMYKSICCGIFGKVCKFEDAVGKDVAEFSNDEILNMLQQLEFISYQSVRSYLIHLRAYSEWYFILNGIDTEPGVNAISTREVDISDGISKSLLSSPEELALWIENMGLIQTLDPLAPLLCLVWYGISADDAKHLRDVDIDQRGKVRVWKATYQIEPPLLGIVMRYMAGIKDESDSELLIKPTRYADRKTNEIVLRNVVTGLSRMCEKNPDVKAITIKAVATSGKLYRMMERITKRNEPVSDALTAEFGAKLDNAQKADTTLMCAVYAKTFYGDDSIMSRLNRG